MAKQKASKKQSAKKSATKRKKVSATEGPLPPKQREKVQRKLRKLTLKPSHPSEITGPSLALDYQAPFPKKSKSKKQAPKRGKKKR